MTHAELSAEDVKLNTTALKWPDKLEPMFEVTQRRIDEHRNAAEIALRTRIKDFEKQLDAYYQLADDFQNNTGTTCIDIASVFSCHTCCCVR